MTKEEKQLLLKDLCVRLPYGVKVHIHDLNVDDYDRNLVPEDISLFEIYRIGIKPYLRSMSSMTEEERQQYWDLCYQDQDDIWGKCRFDRIVDFCLERHLDYRSLIEKGLALEAKKWMYKH